MNCRQTQELLSAYLDRQLTGQEMLAIETHLERCTACDEELAALRRVKYLLRSLGGREASPELGVTISLRVEQSRDAAISLPLRFSRLQRGRPLATAFALSCLAVFVAASPFSPAVLDSARTEGRDHALSVDWLSRGNGTELFDAPLRTTAPTAFWHSARPAIRQEDSDSRYARLYAQPSAAGLDADPLSEPAVNGYAQGDVTLANTPTR